MIIYVLTKQYYDKSGFIVCGATDKQDIAQAFETGAMGTDPAPVLYVIDTDKPLLPEGHPALIGALS